MQQTEMAGRSLLQRRVLVFVGGYGAGKTQISLSMALRLVRAGRRIALADLDLINPYFRSREMAVKLEREGVEVIRPAGELALAENPSLVPKIEGALRDKTQYVILDVGGDEAGATVLGRYHPFVTAGDAAVLQVVNVYRPFSTSVEEIEELRRGIELKAHCQVQGWIHNSNLQTWTTLKDWELAGKVMGQLIVKSGIPLAGCGVEPEWAERVGLTWNPEWIPIERFLSLGWRVPPSD
ncbi:MAG: hypothetical protein ACYCVD_01360 [Desulfitobacteriaceae bacterium]